MALEKFEHYNFTPRILKRIALANSILADLSRQGYSISLRQLYYQLVTKGDIPNSQKEYKKLGDTLSKARLAGLVDWRSLEDRGRQLDGWSEAGYEQPSDYFSGLDSGYYINWWEGQENYVEVWVEKDALSGVVERPCNRHRVRYFATKGYNSQSEAYKAGKRFAQQEAEGRTCHILHLGDHDPSGIDMTRDNTERTDMFAGVSVNVHRIALNMPQIEELNPPPNPAKMTDSRVGEYIRLYGRQSWELDALPPAYIDKLIDANLRQLIDTDLMAQRKAREEEEADEVRSMARAVAENYRDLQAVMVEHGWL